MRPAGREISITLLTGGGLIAILGVVLLLQGSSMSAAWLGTSAVIAGLLAVTASTLLPAGSSGASGGMLAWPAPGVQRPQRTTSSADTGANDLPLAEQRTEATDLFCGDCPGQKLGELSDCFARWLDQQDPMQSLWPAFDRWVRDVLHQFLRGRRVRCYRVEGEGKRLVSLTSDAQDANGPETGMPPLLEHVVSTGRWYVAGARSNGELVNQLAAKWPDGQRAPDWLIPVRARNRTIGVVIAGELPAEVRNDFLSLNAIGNVLEIFWRHVDQSEALARAEQTDRASGVLTRVDLTARAERILEESRRDGEPAVVLALAVEGVRRLDDQGHWRLRDELMGHIGAGMRRKLRSDDVIGRFSEDRFVAVLRRLDLALGELIAQKLHAAVAETIQEQPTLAEVVRIRCGLTDAGSDGFESGVARAFEALRQARLEKRDAPLATTHCTPDSHAPPEVAP